MNETKMSTMNWGDTPRDWPLCLNSQCPRSGHCLRHEAARHLTDGQTATVCIKTADADGNCDIYVSRQPVAMARGFDRAFASLRSRDARYDIRQQLTVHFGNRGNYYRAKHGLLLLTPTQQQPVEQVFRHHGFDGDDVFDERFTAYSLEATPVAGAPPRRWLLTSHVR